MTIVEIGHVFSCPNALPMLEEFHCVYVLWGGRALSFYSSYRCRVLTFLASLPGRAQTYHMCALGSPNRHSHKEQELVTVRYEGRG